MILAIASGKGGTGKTMVSSSLVRVWPRRVMAVDLDVEAPNLHLFLTPRFDGTQSASMTIPVVDEARCNRCRACSDICQFKAISILGEVVMVFDDMCHGCGACMAICPENAISQGSRILGDIHWGRTGKTDMVMGRLRIGEAMSPPLIRAVMSRALALRGSENTDILIDAPPGVSCPAVNAVMDADAILLVTEPTPFGLYDLKLAREAFGRLGTPMAVVINRSGLGTMAVHDYCRETRLPIIGQIPYDRKIAEAYAAGRIIADISGDARALFARLSTDAIILGETAPASPEECCNG
jgi:MinD superfamily P-loop ATPase